MELMGEFPKSVAFSGKYSSDFFNRKGTRKFSITIDLRPDPTLIETLGELRHIQKLRFWPLGDVLHDKYLLPKEEADMIASFLNPMLRLIPEKRAKASELIHHAWLDTVVVQGEIDIIRRAEEEDVRRRAITTSTKQDKGKAVVSAAKGKVVDLEEDAMKPVEDAIIGNDVPKIAVPVPSSSSGKENANRTVPALHSIPPHHASKPSGEHKR